MTLEVALHPDELPIADWVNTRMNQPPPTGAWQPGACALIPPNTLAFDDEIRQILVDLVDLYADTSFDDHDLNPEAVNAALRLREKITSAI